MYEEIELDTTLDDDEREDFLVAVAAVMAADDKVLTVESAYLDELTVALGFRGDEPGLKARVESALAEPKDLDDALRYVLHPGLRRTLFRVLVSSATVDGELHDKEREALRRAATLLKLDPDAVEAYLGWTQRMASVQDELRESLQAELQELLPRLA